MRTFEGFTKLRALRSRSVHSGGRRLAWSPDGRLLAVAESPDIHLWDPWSGGIVRTLRGEHEIQAMSFAPTGAVLASAGSQVYPTRSSGGVVQLWDVANGTVLALHDTPHPKSLAFARSGRMLVTGHVGEALAWNVYPGSMERWFDVAMPGTCQDVALDAAGRVLAMAGDMTSFVWAVGRTQETYVGPPSAANAVDPAGGVFAQSAGPTVEVRQLMMGHLVRRLEGHTGPVYKMWFALGGRLLVTLGADNAIRFWNTATWECVRVNQMPPRGERRYIVAVHPDLPLLAITSRDGSGANVHAWEYDPEALLGLETASSVAYTTAKVVLVGDSGTGKTGLGYRLAHGEFRDHPSTHGQQFWLVDDLGVTRPDRARCEAILWDLAGQPDYRLTHALFLDDADLALVLFDPTRDDAPLHGVEYWLRHLAGRPAILVAARADRGSPRLAPHEIERFCTRSGVRAWVTTSALTGEGMTDLVAQIRAAIAWDERPTTITTETFKRIKDYVFRLKSGGGDGAVSLTAPELRTRLEREGVAEGFSDAEMLTAVGHLAHHGYVARLRTSKGEERILLVPELLNNLASSIVLEARRNPKGLGAIEEGRLLGGEYHLPELDVLSAAEREVLIDSAVAMFLDHNVCFRETDPLNAQVYLVFPGLINLRKPAAGDREAVEETVAYTVSGAVENVHASLVVLLGYSNTFARANQWHNEARYRVADGQVCGFRLEAEREGELDFVLYFAPGLAAPVRGVFQGLFESFLARPRLTVQRYEPVACARGHQLNRAVVREHLAEGSAYAFCSRCGERLALPVAKGASTRRPVEVAEVEAATARARFEQALFRLNAYVTQEGIAVPECFVSYAWGDPAQERWVEHELAADLLKAGLAVVLDRWENSRVGASVSRFVERVHRVDRVIVVGTPRYRTKYDNARPMGGFVVAAEGDLIGTRMLGGEGEKESVLPILLEGEAPDAFPPLLHGRVHADFRDPDAYFTTAFGLIISLYRLSPQAAVITELRDLLDS